MSDIGNAGRLLGFFCLTLKAHSFLNGEVRESLENSMITGITLGHMNPYRIVCMDIYVYIYLVDMHESIILHQPPNY